MNETADRCVQDFAAGPLDTYPCLISRFYGIVLSAGKYNTFQVNRMTTIDSNQHSTDHYPHISL